MRNISISQVSPPSTVSEEGMGRWPLPPGGESRVYAESQMPGNIGREETRAATTKSEEPQYSQAPTATALSPLLVCIMVPSMEYKHSTEPARFLALKPLSPECK